MHLLYEPYIYTAYIYISKPEFRVHLTIYMPVIFRLPGCYIMKPKIYHAHFLERKNIPWPNNVRIVIFTQSLKYRILKWCSHSLYMKTIVY